MSKPYKEEISNADTWRVYRKSLTDTTYRQLRQLLTPAEQNELSAVKGTVFKIQFFLQAGQLIRVASRVADGTAIGDVSNYYLLSNPSGLPTLAHEELMMALDQLAVVSGSGTIDLEFALYIDG